jgi:hypothetical protein
MRTSGCDSPTPRAKKAFFNSTAENGASRASCPGRSVSSAQAMNLRSSNQYNWNWRPNDIHP